VKTAVILNSDPVPGEKIRSIVSWQGNCGIPRGTPEFFTCPGDYPAGIPDKEGARVSAGLCPVFSLSSQAGSLPYFLTSFNHILKIS
jgi:hypothetical protein